MKRYNPFLVGLHWVLALMILIALIIGGPSLAAMANDDPGKLFGLKGHMIWGLAIGALMIIRLALRLFSQKPPHADAGNGLLNFGAQAAHWGLYALMLAMVGGGIATAYATDLFAIVFSNAGALPESFDAITARQAHGIVAKIILALVGLHIIGWAYHQFVLKDGLISRMWFGKRNN